MKNRTPHAFIFASLVAMLAMPSSAAPIRVGMFTGSGATSSLNHTNIHSGSSVIATMLANPQAANLGPSLVTPQQGILVSGFGTTSGGGAPSTEQINAFVAALDTLDVVVFFNTDRITSFLTDSTARARLEHFASTRGVVSIHATSEFDVDAWTAWESLHGTRVKNILIDREGTVRLDSTASTEPAWKFLNRGLPDTLRFVDEWLFFVRTGAEIRAMPGVRVSLNLKEDGLNLAGLPPMGDHPITWYKVLPDGGKFFYTAIGHRYQNFTGGVLASEESVRFVRRHIYNAILWTANVDSTGTVASVERRDHVASARFSDHARISVSGGVLAVSLLRDGAHALQVHSLDGRLLQARRGTGRMEHRVEGLRPRAVYTVRVTSDGQQSVRLVTMP